MPLPNTFITCEPLFTVKDWDIVNKANAEFSSITEQDEGSISYMIMKMGDELLIHENYVDAMAVMRHMPAVKEPTEAVLPAIDLLHYKVYGPKEEIEKLVETVAPFGGQLWETIEGGFTNLSSFTSESVNANFCVIYPLFTVTDWDRCMEEFVKPCQESTVKEEGCLYYGFCRNGDNLFCREAYVDGDAVKTHLENAGAIIGPNLESGVLKLDYLAILGPAEELEKTKSVADGFGALYKETVLGFQKLVK